MRIYSPRLKLRSRPPPILLQTSDGRGEGAGEAGGHQVLPVHADGRAARGQLLRAPLPPPTVAQAGMRLVESGRVAAQSWDLRTFFGAQVPKFLGFANRRFI